MVTRFISFYPMLISNNKLPNYNKNIFVPQKQPIHAPPVTKLVAEEPLLMHSSMDVIGGKTRVHIFCLG